MASDWRSTRATWSSPGATAEGKYEIFGGSTLESIAPFWKRLAPIVWTVRDGLGPDSQDSGWVAGGFQFAGIWGMPALVLAMPLFGYAFIKCRLAVVSQTRIEPVSRR